MDGAEFIVSSAVELHQKMIKEYRGAPGVTEDKYAEGMQVRHAPCCVCGLGIVVFCTSV